MLEILLPVVTLEGLQTAAFVVLGALLIDGVVGDPVWFYRHVPHPIVIIGKLIERLEAVIFRANHRPTRQTIGGAILVFVCLVVFGAAAIAVAVLCSQFSGGDIVLMIVGSIFLAGHSLFNHVSEVAAGLAKSVAEGRIAVAKIVGRDPNSLDEAGIARAAIESLAENFSDGVVAPVFWFVLFGFPGLVVYKVINTLDSMIGHRNERYEWFGKFAARLDDAVNWPAARLSGLLLALAAIVYPGFRGRSAIQAMFRDARKHKSLNAGWPEAAMAGAIHVALAGPRVYDGVRVEDVWMGDGEQDISASDIRRALKLYAVANVIMLGMLAVIWLL
jgi:adenosylcobinamide-phosphate synthase